MPRLGPITRAELIRKLRAAGFDGPFQGKKHAFMMRDGVPPVRLPNTDIDDPNLLRNIIRQADISRDDFMNL